MLLLRRNRGNSSISYSCDTLADAGFEIATLASKTNPIYMIKYSDASMPIIALSKAYNHPFNPSSSFAAVMT